MDRETRRNIALGAYEAFCAGDFDRLAELVRPDVVVRLDPAIAPSAELEFRGLDELRRLFSEVDHGWRVRARACAFAEIDGTVAMLSKVEAGSVRPAAMLSASVWQFEGGRIGSVDTYTDPEQIGRIKRRFGLALD